MYLSSLPEALNSCISIRTFNSRSMAITGHIVNFGVAIFLTKNFAENLESFVKNCHQENHETRPDHP